MLEIKDLNQYPTNERNGMYGGKAGDKEGITIDGEYWIVKYPKSTKGMKGKLDSYTTAPLSEYIGSQIYQMLGIETHDTMLGIRNDKLVVACKDFCKNEGSLREIRTLKNVYNKELSEKLEQSISATSESHHIDIEDIMLHLQHNPVLSKVPDIEQRFWEQFLVDMFINNNDRNNGNWGVLYEDGKYKLAPVFDNGASFANKTPEERLMAMSGDDNLIQQSINSNISIYRINGHRIHGKDLMNIENEAFYKVATEIIPKIKENMGAIFDLVQNIPEQVDGITVCSASRQFVYLRSMEMRLEQFFEPVYEKAAEYLKAQAKTSVKANDIPNGMGN